jgi:hypothetical protein
LLNKFFKSFILKGSLEKDSIELFLVIHNNFIPISQSSSGILKEINFAFISSVKIIEALFAKTSLVFHNCLFHDSFCSNISEPFISKIL